MQRRVFRNVLLFLGVTMAVAVPAMAEAGGMCFPVSGRFFSAVVTPDQGCTSPVGFCTSGELTGALNGSYDYVGSQFLPPGDPPEPSVPTVSFYTGYSTVVSHGDVLYLTDTGALDFFTGKLSALLTVTGGEGHFAGATGYLHVTGGADLQTGNAAGWYRGEVCTAP